MSPDAPILDATRGWIEAADTLGHVLAAQQGTLPPRGTTVYGTPNDADSSIYLRIDRSTGLDEFVVGVRRREMKIVATYDSRGFRGVTYYYPPLATREQITLSRDGWIAVARLDPYRVDWRPPGGEWILGKAIPFQPVKVTAREKTFRIALMDAAESGKIINLRKEPPSRERSKQKHVLDEWPDFIPPFLASARFFTTPNQRVLILRTATADNPGNLYDIVDRKGELKGRLSLPVNESVLGFGVRSVYILEIDDDGVQWIRRHRWPAAP
jgi:hypothetical protein